MAKEKVTRFVTIVKDRFLGAEITYVSVLIAYYTLLSLFPLMVVVGNMLPYLQLDFPTLLEYLEVIVPDAIIPILTPILESLLTTSNSGLLTIGTIALLWSASRGFNYLQVGLNKCYGLKASSGYLLKRAISLATMLVVMAIAIVLFLVFGFGDFVLNWLEPLFDWAGPLADTLHSVKWPATIIFVFCLMVVVYTLIPDTRVRIWDSVPGALLTTAGLLVLVWGFSLYLRFAAGSFSSYGTLSAFFLLMFWLNFSAMVILGGGILNASIAEYRCGKAEPLTGEIAETVRNRPLRRFTDAWKRRHPGKNTPDTAEGESNEAPSPGDAESENDEKQPR